MRQEPKRQKTVRHAGEYCTAECGNRECPVNLSKCQKGERFTVSAFWKGEQCRGYRKP